MIQGCSLYRDRKDGATTTASPRGSRSKITLYYQMMNFLKVTLHRIVTFLIFPKSLNLSRCYHLVRALRDKKIGPVRFVCRFMVTYSKTFNGVLPLI